MNVTNVFAGFAVSVADHVDLIDFAAAAVAADVD